MTLRTVTHAIGCGAAMFSLAATGPDMYVKVLPVSSPASSQLAAQSIASRISALRNDEGARFTFSTRSNVCGDGNRVVVHSVNGDNIRIEEITTKGSYSNYRSTNNGNSDILRNCFAGPAHVLVRRNDNDVASITVSVGGTSTNATTTEGQDLGQVSAAEAVQYFLAVSTTAPKTLGGRALFAASIADAPEEFTNGLLAITKRKNVPEETRGNAIGHLGESNDPRVMPRLKEILADNSEVRNIRSSVLYAIYEQKSPETLSLLLNTAKTDPEKEVRSSAVHWLGQMAGDKATQGLSSILGDDSEEVEVRQSAVYAVSQQKSEESLDLLIKVATTSKEPQLRRSAMYWLGQKADNPRVLKLFQDILSK